MIQDLVDSKLSTALLEAMFRANEAMIRNLKACELNPKNLIGWRNQLNCAISIRKAMEGLNEEAIKIDDMKQDREYDLARKNGDWNEPQEYNGN
jgi:hypothetical protein